MGSPNTLLADKRDGSEREDSLMLLISLHLSSEMFHSVNYTAFLVLSPSKLFLIILAPGDRLLPCCLQSTTVGAHVGLNIPIVGSLEAHRLPPVIAARLREPERVCLVLLVPTTLSTPLGDPRPVRHTRVCPGQLATSRRTVEIFIERLFT